MTPRQQRFIEYYVELKNAAEAARRAGYSANSAPVLGSNLLRNPNIAAALAERGVDIAVPPPRLRLRDPQGLTQRQRRFVEAYLIEGNATAAARAAGYSARSAQAISSELLEHPRVAAVLEQENAARAERTRISAGRVLKEYARLSFVNIQRFVRWGPDGVTLRDDVALDADDTAAVQEVVVRGGKTPVTRIRLFDKQRALDGLARHLRLFDKGAGKAEPNSNDPEVRDARAELRERLLKLARGGG